MRCHTLQKIGLPLITLASCRTVLTEKLTSHIPKCPPPVPVLNQLDPVHTLTSHFLKDPSLYYSPIYTLVLQMVSFPPASHQNPVHTSAIPHTCYMPRPSHSSRFDEEYRSLSSSLCSFLHFPVTSSLLGPNILLNTLFSNTLSLRSSLNVNDQVSHPYKTTNKIIVLCILISILLDKNWKTKLLHQMIASIPRLQSALIKFITFAKFLTFLSRLILII